ncbi:Dachshund like protein 1 [Chelonia mydas]|uniref:Dachshund like protein 1 n=1 Tax=Chelonia mydas TaxID=8469 RepID=M7BM63_CHEMY|nr:Dachshund like protein 1 [Chelonia mydas]
MVDLRGAKVASFTVEGCELICLPQAFDLFLKHLVGGLHTVYTKLKRLEITPVVCNVEQSTCGILPHWSPPRRLALTLKGFGSGPI